MDYDKLLDKCLKRLSKGNDDFLWHAVPKSFTEEEVAFVHPAAKRLEKDGFAREYVPHNPIGIQQPNMFSITLNGLIALQEGDGKYYQKKKEKQKLDKIWSIVKVVAVVINALAVLAFTVLTYIYKK